MAKQNITTVAMVFILSLAIIASLGMVSASPGFTMSFTTPTEDQVFTQNFFTAVITASETLATMDINLDGGAYYHACDNCNGFSVPVDRLQDGQHNLNLIGVSLDGFTKDITINFSVDTTAPTVTAVLPAVGATDVAANTNVVATFSENIQTSTVTSSSFTLRDSNNVAVAGSVSASGNTATFNPTSDLQAGTQYTATLTSDIKDLAGNSMAQGTWTFTTSGSGNSNTTTNNTTTNNTTTNNTNTTSGPYAGFSLVFTNPTEGQVINSNDFTVTVAANETVDMMRVNLDGGSYVVACTNCNGFSVPATNVQDGTHNLNVIATWGSVTQDTTVNFVIDTSGNTTATDTTAPAPVSSLFASVTGETFITWTWTNPADSDFQSAVLYFNNANVVNTSSSTYTADGLSSNTTYNLTLYTRDATGNVNWNGVSSIITTLPSSNPVNNTNNTGNSSNQNQTNVTTLNGFAINSPTQGQTFNDELHIDITAGDATNINYSVDGGEFDAYAGHTIISLAEGTHVLTVRASNDQAFNETSINFNIVNTTGTEQNNTNQTNNNTELVMFNVTSPINGSVYNDSVLLNITECDHDSVNYSVDGGEFINYTEPAVIPLAAGMHNITVLGSNSIALDEVVIYFTIVNSSTTPTAPGNETNQTDNNQTNQTGNNGNSNNNANNNVNTGSSNGGSGGSGAAFRVFQTNDADVRNGYAQLVGRNDKIYFSLLGDNNSARYVLMVKSVSNGAVQMQVRNVHFNLTVGESTRLNLTGSDQYDLYVMLNSMQNGRANVTVQTINDTILPATTAQTLEFDNSASTEGEATATSDTEEGSTLITGNAIAEGNSNTNSNTNVFARVFNFVQSIFRNMFSSIGGMFNR